MSSTSDHIDSFSIQAAGIRVSIITWGAALQSVIVKDKEGKERDVVVGFDEPADYVKERTFNGAVIGRYGNRIGKGTFTIDGQDFHTPQNEQTNTLHGGNKGYDQVGFISPRTDQKLTRLQVNWTLVSQSDSSVTLSFLDKAEFEGFPGDVLNHITYTVAASPARLTVRIVSLSLDQRTPIMPTTHTYYNLSGFQTSNILKDTLHLPNASRVIETDDVLAPNGEFLELHEVAKGGTRHLLDFTSPKQFPADARDKEFDADGPGIDHAYVFDIDPTISSTSNVAQGPVQFQWSSPATGIRLTLRTNQHGIQIYTAKHHDGSAPVKKSQRGGESEHVQRFGCLALEPQDYIDGVNNPKWGREGRQIYGPKDGPNVNWAEYSFDTI